MHVFQQPSVFSDLKDKYYGFCITELRQPTSSNNNSKYNHTVLYRHINDKWSIDLNQYTSYIRKYI